MARLGYWFVGWSNTADDHQLPAVATAAQKSESMRTFLRRVVWVMLAGVLLYGAFVLYTGLEAIKESLENFAPYTFLIALALATANYGLRFAKWEYYLARLGIRSVPKHHSLLIFLSGFVLTVTPGKVGEVFKSAVLSETYGIQAARTAPIIFAERLTDVIGVIILIVIGSTGFSGGLVWAAIGSTGVVVALILVLWQKPLSSLVSWLEKGPARLRPLASKMADAQQSLRIVATPSALLWPSLLSLIGWGAEGIALYCLLLGFSADVSPALAVFAYATATLAGAVIPVPGGLGVAEALIQEQLVHLGNVPHGSATSAMILIRFATLWWAVLVGFFALALLRRSFPGLLRETASVTMSKKSG